MDTLEKRLEYYSSQSKYHERLVKRYALLRGITFMALVAGVGGSFNSPSIYWPIVAILSLMAFVVFISNYRKQAYVQSKMQAMYAVSKEALLKTRLELTDMPSGEAYRLENHAFQDDLDILGQHSLFQLFNHCTLPGSRELLAKNLSSTPSHPQVMARKEAISELSANYDWLIEFQALTRMAHNKKKKDNPNILPHELISWAKYGHSKRSSPPLWVAYIFIGCFLGVSLAVLLFGWPYQALFVNLLVNGCLLLYMQRPLSELSQGMSRAKYMIDTYLQAIHTIGTQDLKATALESIQHQLASTGAEKAISQLSKLYTQLSMRANMLYPILDVLFLLDFFLTDAIVKWKRKHHSNVESWLNAVHETEYLGSIASFAHTHPHYVLPTIEEDPFTLVANQIGHPLIPHVQRIPNDYSLNGAGSVDVITGSNMSGKSTFQRTLGINMVMAWQGAPVCAKGMSTGLAAIFTSMRTKDNLKENTSSFYAELKRIKQLLDMTQSNEPIFILLDEILKGTNSEDRQAGSMELVVTMTSKQVFGLISTHDLELGLLEEKLPQVRNYSFNSTLDGNKIHFDYLLTPGVCKSFNASQLMKNMGIIPEHRTFSAGLS